MQAISVIATTSRWCRHEVPGDISLLALTTVIGTLIWLLTATVIAGESAARDVARGMHPLVYTSPISKAEYLGGRFLAAFVLNALLLLAVQAGILLGVHMPGANARLIGPFRPEAFLTAYTFISLVNAFAATAIQFFLAARVGRAMAGFLGSVFLVFMGFFVATIVNFFVKRGLGSLLDPVGINFIVQDLAHSWTTVEKNWRLLTLEGTVLQNRLIWSGVGLGVVAITYVSFRFAHRTTTTLWSRLMRRREAHAPVPADIATTVSTPVSIPQIRQTFEFVFHLRQTAAIASASFRTIARSWPGLAMLVPVPLISVLVVIDQMSVMAVPLLPTTARVIGELTAPLSAELSRWVIVPLLITFFAGELVWREREAGRDEFTDTLPGSEWAPFFGTFH